MERSAVVPAGRPSRAAAGLVAMVLVCTLAVRSTADDPAPGDEQVARRHGITVEQVRRLHGYRKLSNAALMGMTPERVRRVLWKLDNPAPDEPGAAAQFRALLQSGGKDVPENAVGKAITEVEKLREA